MSSHKPICKRLRKIRRKGIDVLKSFRRWPTWMWGNWEVAALIEWLHDYNKTRPSGKKVGFYGLDVYSLWESMDVMINYLSKEDPDAAQLAIEALGCFEPYGEGQDYARAMLQLSATCRDEVLKPLKEVRRKSRHYDHDAEAALNSEMNAQVIANAEKYYRATVSFRDDSWNIRDTHMVETLNALMKFHGVKPRTIVWAHNTHIGHARFTDMRREGLLNVGQLVREQHERQGVFIAGFASYKGTVIAGRSWGAAMEAMTTPPAAKASVEELLHSESAEDRIIFSHPAFEGPLPHRAIGVVYHPKCGVGKFMCPVYWPPDMLRCFISTRQKLCTRFT